MMCLVVANHELEDRNNVAGSDWESEVGATEFGFWSNER